jgi:hypothetical protein
MPILTQPAFGPRTALAYVTGGAILDAWTIVWYSTRDHALSKTEWFWVAGFFLTGLIFVVLGFLLGPLGRAARQAELPPAEAMNAEASIQRTAAANPPAVAASMQGAMPAAPATPQLPPGTVIANPPATMRVT